MKFSEITLRLMSRYPVWCKIKWDTNSIGAQFLNVFGLEFDDVKFLLDYIFQQTKITDIDKTQLNVVYKGRIPKNVDMTKAKIYGDGILLKEVKTYREFIGMSHIFQFIIDPEIYIDHPCYIDYENGFIYVKRLYNKQDDRTGSIDIVEFENNQISNVTEVKIVYHSVWNALDEFALLLGLQRHYMEDNLSLYKRILDVFRTPVNSTRIGLILGIARDLGLYKEKVWYDGKFDFVIDDIDVIPESILVDGVRISENAMYQLTDGRYAIKGSSEYAGIERVVKYYYGVNLVEFKDVEKFNPDMSVNKFALEIVDEIDDKLGLKLDKIQFDTTEFDRVSEDNISSIPLISDYGVEK